VLRLVLFTNENEKKKRKEKEQENEAAPLPEVGLPSHLRYPPPQEGWRPSPLKTQEWVSTPSIGWTSIERENENGEPTRGVPLVEGIMILK